MILDDSCKTVHAWLLCAAVDVFQISSKNFMKLGWVLQFAFKIWQTKNKRAWQVFGCSLINFTIVGQSYDFAEH